MIRPMLSAVTPRVELAVDRDHRRQTARAEAGHDLEAEQSVARRLAGLDLQRPLEAFEASARPFTWHAVPRQTWMW